MTDVPPNDPPTEKVSASGPSRVVLHIGTHKTATTTIQDMFWENSALLKQHGLIYPRLGRVTGHHGLVADWVTLPPVYDLPGGSRSNLEALARQYADEPVTLFLSSEEFSRGAPNSSVDFAELRQILSGFDEIRVMCNLRTQWEFIQSVYLEVSKYRNPPRPPQILKTVYETGMIEGLWADYRKLLDKLETVFAPEEITFLNFDDLRKSEGGVIGAYLRLLDLDIAPSDLTEVNQGASNVSPRPLTAWMANVMADPYRAPVGLLDLVEEAVQLEYDEAMRSCIFTREEFHNLADHFAPLNEELIARRAPYQPGFSIKAPDITPLSVFRNAIPASLWVRVARRQTARLMKAGVFD